MFEYLFLAYDGHLHINGIVLSRERLNTTNLVFNEKLLLAQDTNFIMKMSLVFNIKVYGPSKTVAVYGAHVGNRWTRSFKKCLKYYSLKTKDLYTFSLDKDLTKAAERKIIWCMARSFDDAYFQSD